MCDPLGWLLASVLAAKSENLSKFPARTARTPPLSVSDPEAISRFPI